ncbi:uncharacterized protein LOC124282250 [Haliotis rubra]|uniref:uncharacterized protein LOC124282250 n=1 Tax=Haliotis rubra TaxID=36100 RepID=UPI001EE5E9EA|nr:uncharacterized protein LOC124282250 [Haliotis rubra]
MRVLFFQETVPCLFNICKAFPPLCDDVTSLLTQIGRVYFSHLTTTNSVVGSNFSLVPGQDGHTDTSEPACKRQRVSEVSSYSRLYNTVQQTFQELAGQAVVTNSIF